MPYSTKQRQAVLQGLERHKAAVTASELAEELRRSGCSVGLATVYRQLERLAETGRVHRVATETGALYQYCDHPEPGGCFLLRCEGCGRLEHLDCPQLQALYRHLAAEHGFQVDPRRTVLTGLCRACGEGEAAHGAV